MKPDRRPPPLRRLPAALLLVAALGGLAGCEQLGIESATATAAKKEADGKAIGAACRHAGRAIEDCYFLNKRADKAAVFAGWREMNDYMRENNIEEVKPVAQAAAAAAAAASAASAAASETAEADSAKASAKGG